MLRFIVPLFPNAARTIAPAAIILGIAGILYGAIQAFGQTDLKRLVAYTSVSHLGFVLLAIFVWNPLALQGALLTIISHGISTGALFVLVGLLQERIHTREMNRMSGLWDTAPRLSGTALFFALASLGLPGLGDFVGEFLILLGTYQRSIAAAAVATTGVLATTFYALRFVQRAFHGPNSSNWRIQDLVPREGVLMGLMIVALLWLGIYPQPVLKMFGPALTRLEQSVSRR
jgi:NADH-quinone oxidoreductase subunit M